MASAVSGHSACLTSQRCTLTYLKCPWELIQVHKVAPRACPLIHHAWTSQRMRQISSTLEVKITISMAAAYTQTTSNISLKLSLPIKPQSQRFTCIQVPLKAKRTVISVTCCYQPPWIGQLSSGTRKLRKNQSSHSRVRKSMCMTFNGALCILVSLPRVMVMAISMSGISIKTRRPQ